MNNRDPFNRHRSTAFDILRGKAKLAAKEITQAAKEVGAQAIVAGSQVYETSKSTLEEMSFPVPQNMPSFSDPQRRTEDQIWGSSGVTARSAGATNSLSGMTDRVGNFFEKKSDLPMYKDKPYSYASSRRRQPIWKKKRALGVGALFVLALLYLLGFFGEHTAANKKAKDGWKYLQRPEKAGAEVDWSGRRERVVDAFTLSWDAYSRYAWGKAGLDPNEQNNGTNSV